MINIATCRPLPSIKVKVLRHAQGNKHRIIAGLKLHRARKSYVTNWNETQQKASKNTVRFHKRNPPNVPRSAAQKIPQKLESGDYNDHRRPEANRSIYQRWLHPQRLIIENWRFERLQLSRTKHPSPQNLEASERAGERATFQAVFSSSMHF